MPTIDLWSSERARASALRVAPSASPGRGAAPRSYPRLATDERGGILPREVREDDAAARRSQATRMCGLGIVLVVTLHVWIISAGWVTWWPQYTVHYNRLAEAFLHRQVSLRMLPAKAHLALPDPYDPEQNKPFQRRAGVHDAVLFDGRFYLYWGPVPALLLVPVKYVAGLSVIGDEYLVFAFTLGTTVFGAMLARNLWGRFFPDAPPWTLFAGVAVAGLSTPVAYTLARSAVYEAAILGGQCFLLAGLYFLFPRSAGGGRERAPGLVRLALAGSCLALAAGSRASLSIAIIAIGLLVVWRTVRSAWLSPRSFHPLARLDLPRLVAFGLPLIAGAAALGAYNHVRFGAWHEFGQRYQLTGANYHSIPALFSVANAWPGMYSYLLRPLWVFRSFPFFAAHDGADTFPAFISLPEHYETNEPIAGILRVTPFVWLALVPVYHLLAAPFGRGAAARDGAAADAGALHWTVLCLLGASLLGFAPVPFMVGSTMRYLADLTPSLLIVALIGAWQVGRSLRASSLYRRAFHALFLFLAGWSVVIGLLLGLSGYSEHFRRFNPDLFTRLSWRARPPVPGELR